MSMPSQIDMLRSMMLIRAFEQALAARTDHGFQLLSSGEEAVAVGICSALEPSDQLLTGGRSIGPALARGLSPSRVMAELLGKATGINKGKGGRGHLADPAAGFFGAHAVVGGNISIAAGVALAMQMTGSNGIVAILFGDGAFGTGALHETLNIAVTLKLPLLFICNNNQLSVSTPRAAVLAPKNLSDIGLTFGIPACTIDGMDVDQVSSATKRAVGYVRAKNGPAFLEFISFRFTSHSTTARETRSDIELTSIKARCPIAKQIKTLIASGILNEDAKVKLIGEVDEIVRAALYAANVAPFPDPAEALTDVN